MPMVVMEGSFCPLSPVLRRAFSSESRLRRTEDEGPMTLPQQLGPAKDRAVGARQAVAPVAPDQRRLGRVGLADADAATLACPHPARHRPLDRDLAFEPPRGGDLR